MLGKYLKQYLYILVFLILPNTTLNHSCVTLPVYRTVCILCTKPLTYSQFNHNTVILALLNTVFFLNANVGCTPMRRIFQEISLSHSEPILLSHTFATFT